jgi:hypothetical protein
MNPTGLAQQATGHADFGIGGVHDSLPSRRIFLNKAEVEMAEQERQEAILKELAQSVEMRAIKRMKREWELELEESSSFSSESESAESLGAVSEQDDQAVERVFRGRDGGKMVAEKRDEERQKGIKIFNEQ